MLETKVDKKTKTIVIHTDYEFAEFKIGKYGEHFHFDFVKNDCEIMGCVLFFNEFNGKKYYPKEIKIENVNKETKMVQLSYS